MFKLIRKILIPTIILSGVYIAFTFVSSAASIKAADSPQGGSSRPANRTILREGGSQKASSTSLEWEELPTPTNSVRVYRLPVRNTETKTFFGYLILTSSSGGEAPSICWQAVEEWQLPKRR